jgi:hypothetical protein
LSQRYSKLTNGTPSSGKYDAWLPIPEDIIHDRENGRGVPSAGVVEMKSRAMAHAKPLAA